jgi:hypothetical protein|tara:strand:- start:150 stop:467 length:318 start_codon:yes stop_codon:yes gene_type:complete
MELLMSACSQCKIPIGLVVTKCHNCGLDFDAFRAKQRKKANSWIIGGGLFTVAMFALIAIYEFLLVPLGFLGTAILLYCAIRRKYELTNQPIEVFTNKSKGRNFY